MTRKHEMERGTWLESGELSYPMSRCACALFPDGKLRIVRCATPDTFFSIPVRLDRVVKEQSNGLGGFLILEDGALKFELNVRQVLDRPY